MEVRLPAVQRHLPAWVVQVGQDELDGWRAVASTTTRSGS